MAPSRSLWCAFLSLFFVVFLNPLSCCFAPSASSRAAGARRRRKFSFPFCPTLPSDGHDCHPHKRASHSLASIRSRFASAFSLESHSTDHNINVDQTNLKQHVAVVTSANILPGDAAAAADTIIRKHSFASRADIFPCTSCGEVFSRAHLLELHQSMKHSLSELSVSEPDSGLNIVRIIFLSCWRGSCTPTVRRVFKIHHSQRTLAHFEEYRDMIRSRSSKWCGAIADGSGDERCIADGNERLRFYCSPMLCSLSADVGVCGSPYCSTCEILRHGFSGKQADLGGIMTYSSGWGAHRSLAAEVEKEFELQQVRRAMLVCRVVAGRVAHGGVAEWMDRGASGRMMFDSVALATYGGGDELVVFNPKAVLPCFVILY